MKFLKSMIIIGIMTFFSRLLGFVRDFLIAQLFGASLVTDAFFIAFKIPNFLRRIFAEGAFSQVFLPIIVEYKKKKGCSYTKKFISNVLGFMILILLLINLVGIFFAPYIISIIAPGFINNLEKFNLTVSLLRIIFPYIFFISLVTLSSSILNTWNYFLVPAFSPILLNITIIIVLIFFSSFFYYPIFSLAWGVFLGGLIQLIYQIFYLNNVKILVLPYINFRDHRLWYFLNKLIPVIIGISASQISLIINTIFSSLVMSGSISWIYYADRIMEFPSGILGVSLSTVLLPALSKNFSQGIKENYSKLLDWGIRFCLIFSIPSAIAIGILSKPIIIVLFQYGNFSDTDTLMTQEALLAYSLGLIAILLVKVLSAAFYSRKDIKTPMKISVYVILLTQLLNIFLINFLQHVGLALSISLAAWMNVVFLFYYLYKKNIFKPQPGWYKFFIKVVLSILVMVLVLLGMLIIMPAWDLGSMSYRILRLAVVFIITGIGYFWTLNLLGFNLFLFYRKVDKLV
ncbi:murein biosynthesis integral membrane protein MurJ [Buchnera aphidicola (Hormaphis cornu)]|nr:murein biosynthesis integral membrane protein MurJ [Buchnera aphidicola (Hormaphis cornu)]